MEATTAYSPSCSTRISGVLRSLPVLAPIEVSTMIGTPSSVLASVPPEASNRSTWSRERSDGLGAYSPVRGMSGEQWHDGVHSGGLSGSGQRVKFRRDGDQGPIAPTADIRTWSPRWWTPPPVVHRSPEVALSPTTPLSPTTTTSTARWVATG